MEGGLSIGAVARAVAVNVETLRYYERRRLIQAPPRSRGWGPKTLVFLRRRFEGGSKDFRSPFEPIRELRADSRLPGGLGRILAPPPDREPSRLAAATNL